MDSKKKTVTYEVRIGKAGCLLFLVVFGLIIYGLLSFTTPFSEGWRVGYQEGWCADEQFPEWCTAPVAPVAPVPEVGRARYEDGYNRGFIQGNKDKKDEN